MTDSNVRIDSNPGSSIPATVTPDEARAGTETGTRIYSPKLVTEQIETHLTEGIAVVARVPTRNVGNVIYLSHDHTEGTKTDITITPGFVTSFGGLTFAGYDDGNIAFDAFGSVSSGSIGPVSVASGPGDATGYSIDEIITFNKHFLDSVDKVVINDVEYDHGTVQLFVGAWRFEVNSPPTGLTGDFTLNFLLNDDLYYYTDGTTTYVAGLYVWDVDASSYAIFSITEPEFLLNEWVEDGSDPSLIGVLTGTLLTVTTVVGSSLITLETGVTIEVGDLLQIDSEIMLVTAVSSTSYTVIRGVYNTSAGGSYLSSADVSRLNLNSGRNLSTRTWVYDADTNENVFDMGLAFVEDDDAANICLNMRYLNFPGGVYLHESRIEAVALLRDLPSLPLTGFSMHGSTAEYIPRTSTNSLLGWGEMIFAIRRRRLTAADETAGLGTEGNDALVVGLGSTQEGQLRHFQMQIVMVS